MNYKKTTNSPHNPLSAEAGDINDLWAFAPHLVLREAVRDVVCCFFLCFFFLSRFSSYSQTSNEPLPVFILQGTVKLSGKPIDGVSLELTKNKKLITKIVTEKNGMYSIEMNKSNTDKETEYLLKIFKEGTVTGILKVNTYTSKEEFDYVPYIFNLDFNLTQSTISDVKGKHDFGKIKWDSERGVFDFDKDYVPVIEKNKDALKTDSSKYLTEATDKIKKEAESKKKKEDAVAKQKARAAATQQLAVKESLNLLSELKGKGDDEKVSTKKTGKESPKTQVAEKAATLSSDKNKNSNLKPLTSALTNNHKSETNPLKKKAGELNKLKTDEKPGKAVDVKEKKEAKQVIGSALQIAETPVKQTPVKPETSNPVIDRNAFDGRNIFSVNNEKNKLLNANEKMEKKKAANLTKKYETSNILTSLLDVVALYDKK